MTEYYAFSGKIRTLRNFSKKGFKWIQIEIEITLKTDLEPILSTFKFWKRLKMRPNIWHCLLPENDSD